MVWNAHTSHTFSTSELYKCPVAKAGNSKRATLYIIKTYLFFPTRCPGIPGYRGKENTLKICTKEEATNTYRCELVYGAANRLAFR